MGKEILTFGDFEIEKNKFYHHITYFLKDVYIEKYWCLKRFLLMKKTISTLLVTCIMIISHYIRCFLKQALIKKF